MDFDDTPDESAYRARVRGPLAEHPADLVHLAAGEEAADARDAQERHPFGRAIGSCQDVEPSLVDAWVGVEQPCSLVWRSARAADRAPQELPLVAASVAAFAAETPERSAETCIQVHRGTGSTREHDAHLHWRRATVDRPVLGDAAGHHDVVAGLVLAGAPA